MLDRSVTAGCKPTRWVVGGAAAVAAVGIAVGGTGPASAADTGSTGSLDVNQTGILVDGPYRVGVDVQPGTYTTAGAWPGSLLPCSWSRIEELPGGGIGVIDTGTSRGPVTVTIEPGDDAFLTGGCRGWIRDGGPGSADTGSSGGSLDFGSAGTGSLGS